MRFKAVPEPPAALADVATVRDALPRVPRSETDCCGRLADRVDWIADREAGREWLLFLRAVGLARRTSDGGYVREGGDDAPAPDDSEALARGLREHVLGASAVLDALDMLDALDAASASEDPSADATADPLDVDGALDALEPELPEWERRRTDDWRAVWRERVERLLEWLVLLGVARRVEDGYVRTGDGDA